MAGFAKNQNDNIRLGIGLIIGTVFTMALADTVIKYIGHDMPLWQIFVLRSVIALCLVGLFSMCAAARNGAGNGVDWRHAGGWVAVRSVILVFMYVTLYAAMPIVDLSVIAAVLYTSPLITTLLSALVNAERVPVLSWGAVLVGFGGVLLIVKPAGDRFDPAMLVPLMTAFFYSLTAVLTRSKCATVHPVVLVVALNVALIACGLMISGGLLLAGWAGMMMPDYPFLFGSWIKIGSSIWGLMAVLAVLFVIVGAGFARAYQLAPSVIIATFDYSYLLFATMFGMLVFAERPDALAVAGMGLIVLAGFVGLRQSSRPETAPA